MSESDSPGYVTRLLHRAWLVPGITQSIATGDHPEDVTAKCLTQALPLPLDWGQGAVDGGAVEGW